MTEANETSGWAWPLNANKAHYFRGGRSLCGGWMYRAEQGELSTDANAPSCCKPCWRRREAELRRAEKSEQP